MPTTHATSSEKLSSRLPVRIAARLLQLPVDIAVERSLRHHAKVLRRLPWQEERRILIEPTDLPVAFMLHCHSSLFRLTVVEKGPAGDAAATIRGPLLILGQLAQGESDGDALFFSRALAVEGDTDVVVALRNAIDDAEIDLIADALPLPAPLVPLARTVIGGLGGLLRTVTAELASVQAVVDTLAPPHSGDGRTSRTRKGNVR